MTDRFVLRPARSAERFKVVDVWTGETAVIAMVPQDDLGREDAEHLAELLNRRARGGERRILA
ncbi:hypothetical protein [Phenylobacterium deserti]|uniref:Uncharacterized protein n=1 Tax=Phenylobacterium deserti TaxID=1914756 RepID=A0A328AIF6_9CAUL|nr:hypothetical protein [Phenylobacterium deserti]RAK52628.1 hypothetical protein DJ018_10515 [Phenylobacterium deserti]